MAQLSLVGSERWQSVGGELLSGERFHVFYPVCHTALEMGDKEKEGSLQSGCS